MFIVLVLFFLTVGWAIYPAFVSVSSSSRNPETKAWPSGTRISVGMRLVSQTGRSQLIFTSTGSFIVQDERGRAVRQISILSSRVSGDCEAEFDGLCLLVRGRTIDDGAPVSGKVCPATDSAFTTEDFPTLLTLHDDGNLYIVPRENHIAPVLLI